MLFRSGPKIEALPDGHRSKAECLLWLGRTLGLTGNYVEQKRLLDHALKLEREWGSDSWVAHVLKSLSTANRYLGLHKDGIRQAKEALEIYEQIGTTRYQADTLVGLALLLEEDNQLDAAEEAASRVIELLPEKGEEFRVCQAHRALGKVYGSKCKNEEAIRSYETALGIASRFDWNSELSWIHDDLATLSCKEGRFDDAHVHNEQARSHSKNDPYQLGQATYHQARIYYDQQKLENATSRALCALEIFQKLGALEDQNWCKDLLQEIGQATSIVPDSSGEPPYAIRYPTPFNPSFLANDTPSSTDTD